MYVPICAKYVCMCVPRGAGQALGTLYQYTGVPVVSRRLLHALQELVPLPQELGGGDMAYVSSGKLRAVSPVQE